MIAFISTTALLMAANAIGAPKSYSVHLASYNKMSDAVNGWKVLLKSHSRYLIGLTPIVSKFRLKTRLYYRLKVGSFPSRIMAFQFCNTLKSRGLPCSVKIFTGEKLKNN